MTSSLVRIVTIVTAAVLAVALGLDSLRGPEPVGAAAPPDAFSADRAMAHVRALSTDERTVGSAGHAKARAYLVDYLSSLGWEVQRQSRTTFSATPSPRFGAVSNVVARRVGAQERAVLLAAHYDTVARSPGANDNAVAVAALLETARALARGPVPPHTILLLFTDAEETGLLGAKAFVDAHPWARQVGVALNFDARGASGPTLMFETSAGNADLIQRLTRALPRVVSASYMTAIYKTMPNNTDFTIFREAGIAGLSFAYIGSPDVYHSARDDAAAVDLATLQQDGSYALALAREFGARLPTRSSDDRVFFPLLRGTFVVYPERWSIALTGVATALLLVAGWRLRRMEPQRVRDVIIGCVAPCAAIAASVIATVAVWLAMDALHGSTTPFAVPFDSRSFVVGSLLLATSIVSGLWTVAGRRSSALAFWTGCVATWLLAAWITSLSVPGASYPFVWPLSCAAAALAWLAARPDRDRRVGPALPLVLSTPGLMALLLCAPIGWLLYLAFGALSAPLIVALLAPIVGLLLSVIPSVATRDAYAVSRVTLTGAASAFIFMAATSGYHADRPRQDTLVQVIDHDDHQSGWYSFDPRPDAWTARFLTATPSDTNLRRLLPTIDAPMRARLTSDVIDSPAPSAIVMDDAARTPVRVAHDAAARILSLRILPGEPAEAMWVSLAPSALVTRVVVDGVQVSTDVLGGSPDPWRTFMYVAPPAEGFRLDIALRTASPSGTPLIDPIRLSLLEESRARPAAARERPRPAAVMPSTIWPTDVTLSKKTFSF